MPDALDDNQATVARPPVERPPTPLPHGIMPRSGNRTNTANPVREQSPTPLPKGTDGTTNKI